MRNALKKIVLILVLSLSFGVSAESFLGVSGAMALPQGGSRHSRVGGATLRAGTYLSDFWAVEGEAAWLEDVAGLGVDALLHAQAWSLYGDLFGYSAFDPFVTLGVNGWIGPRLGQVGPRVGAGAFYHLTDSWSLRADATATLGLDSSVEMIYSLSVGIQYGF